MAESEMVERCAKVHYERLHYTRWENLTPSTREGFIAAMRAAIEEMREPTEEMYHAAVMTHVHENGGIEHSPGLSWKAMIDAALSPSTKEKSNG